MLAGGAYFAYQYLTKEKQSCGAYGDVIHGKVTYTETTQAGDTATIVCEAGYEMKGDNLISCLQNGSWSQASQCHKVACRISPAVLENGNINVNVSNLNSGIYTVGDSLNATCDSSYHRVGAAVVVCQVDGSWSTSPECIACGKTDNNKLTGVTYCNITGMVI